MIKVSPVLLALSVTLLTAASSVPSARAEAPVKEIFSDHIGWNVDNAGGNVCAVECKLAEASSEPGGFNEPEGVAVAADGDLYVGDQSNFRVQKLSSTGAFLLMFGKEVNKDGSDICTASELSNCKSGESGAEAGGFVVPESVAVEPAGSEEDVYIEDAAGAAVDRDTAQGVFVDRIGKEVNETKVNEVNALIEKGETPTAAELEEENLCTAASHDICKEGVRRESENLEHMAFGFDSTHNMLAVVGTQHILYVGDGARIQKFKPNGEWSGEIPLAGIATSFAVDEGGGTVYIIYGEQPEIHEYSLSSETELSDIAIPSVDAARGIAVDTSGRVAVSTVTIGPFGKPILSGDLYEASSTNILSGIRVPGSPSNFTALTFGDNGMMYGVAGREILAYQQLPVGEVETQGSECEAGPQRGSSNTFTCRLEGMVNPYNVAKTEAYFEWGKTCAPGSLSPRSTFGVVEKQESLDETIENLRPNEKSLCFRAIGQDENAQLPESFVGNAMSFATEPVSPKIVATSTSFPTTSSAVLFAELNPENAPTAYHFELAAEPDAAAKLSDCHDATVEVCSGVISTQVGDSGAYGDVGATLEVKGLQPATTYLYRLEAENSEVASKGLQATSGTGTFTTESAPVVEAFTGVVSAISATSVIVSGSVNPDGAQATYTFELGTYEGGATQYDVVASGSTGSGIGAEPVSLLLSSLRPGVAYSYRVGVHSGYGNAFGAPVIFTTNPLPIQLSSSVAPPVLTLPPISFPVTAVKCKSGFKLNAANKCVKTPRAKRKMRKHKVRRKGVRRHKTLKSKNSG